MPDHLQSAEMAPPAAIRETVEEAPDMQVHERPAKRRKKDASDRTRVSRACDRCKRKKTRCSGRQPCTLCVGVGTSCEFTATYTRGRPPSVLPDIDGEIPVLNGSTQTIGNSSSNVHEAVNQLIGLGVARPTQAFQAPRSEDSLYRQPLDTRNAVSSTDMTHLRLNISGQADSRAQSSRNSPELPQTDLQGHFVGPSSGVSFLLRVQKKLHQAVTFSQESSIFTFGDAPLPDFNPSFFVLPPYPEAQKLVARYFDFGAATHRFLHRPTVEAWLEEFYENLGQMTQKNGAQEKTALLFMVFATAKEYSPEARNSGSVDTSARYFQAAEHQLSMETGQIRLTNVQARLCQCLYLLSQSRVNHCWSHFGTTARLIFALGIHRKRRTDPSNNIDHIEQECRKRVFWCAYGLDSYLSAALGRPRTFHDEDIDQELPTLVDDSDLTSQRIITTNTKAQSIMMGAIAHNRLAKIISRILRDIYPIRPPSLQTRVALGTKFSEELTSWRKELSRFLDADSFYVTLLPPVFQRQRNVLNLAYYHTLILIHRPFLLSNFASLNSRRAHTHGAPTTADIEQNVRDCLDAAIHIAAIVNELHEAQQIFRAFWFTHYFAFCAVVVLYVHTIQQRSAPEETYRIYFEVAEKCQTQISSMADKESLVQRYSVVLEELRLEAVKQRQGPRIHQRIQQTQFNDLNNPNQITAGTTADELGNGDGAVFGEDQHGTTPSSMMAELTGWGEFDSLVTAGMGGLDFGFMGDLDQNDTWNRGITNGMGNLAG